MARYSEGVGMLMGHLGGQIGTVDSSINAAVSAKSGDGTGTITGTITGIANAATMFPGKAPGVVGGSVVLLTNVAKNGGDLSKLTIDLLRKYPEDLQFPNEIRKPNPKKRQGIQTAHRCNARPFS